VKSFNGAKIGFPVLIVPAKTAIDPHATKAGDLQSQGVKGEKN